MRFHSTRSTSQSLTLSEAIGQSIASDGGLYVPESFPTLGAEDFAGLTNAPLDRVSLFSILEHDYGLEIAHADEEIDATTADPYTARLLSVAHGAPVLRIRQVIYSTKGKATLYVLGLYRSDRHTLLIRRFR